MTFPENFIWGAAAASYQIEGGTDIDGKGHSIWDMYSHQSGKIWQSNNGDVGCDHYHHWKEDIRLMKEIGLHAYRLSISWTRILPDGTGKINMKGLDFYNKILDELLKNGIEPWITLFHWDYPYKLFLKGGWLNPSSSDWFAEYTSIVIKAFSDRVKNWITFNEPQVFLHHGHFLGDQAPGIKLDFKELLICAHNVLLSHGKAVRVIRENSKKNTRVGVCPVGITKIPAKNTPHNIEIAEEATFKIKNRDLWNNTWFSDPILKGNYPEDGLKLFQKDLPDFHPDDMNIINQPVDYYGMNMYFGELVDENEDAVYVDGNAITSMDWPVTPEVCYYGPKFLYDRYKLPLIIFENGMANNDWVHLDGKVHDPQRIDFISRYLKEYKRAINDGVNAIGYFYWSIMDNFEWTEGYKKRFGLIHIDFQTLKRTLKDSAFFYKNLIQTNGDNI